jgi:hypothetical protein
MLPRKQLPVAPQVYDTNCYRATWIFREVSAKNKRFGERRYPRA